MPLPHPLTTRPRLTPPRRVASAAFGVLAVLLAASSLPAKQGAVRTKDKKVYFGDVTDIPSDAFVTVKEREPGKQPRTLQIDRRNVLDRGVTFFQTPREEFDARMAYASASNDAGLYVDAGRWAMVQKEPDWAQQALTSARAIAPPGDARVKQLDAELTAVRPRPATQPVTQPVRPATNPADVVDAGGKRPRPAIRTLTADEINALRQLEWQGDKGVTVKIDPDLRKRYMDIAGITNAQAKAMAPQDMAWDILQKGTPDMRRDLKLVNDPLPLKDYRQLINNKIIGTNTGCAAAACHAPQAKAGNFVLFPGNDETAGLTNFIILNQYYKDIKSPRDTKPQQYLMIDRTQPAQSLLIHYALPPELTELPHPEVKGYRGVIRNRGDKNYSSVVDWITQSLVAVPPPYDEMFDLTKEPKEKEKKDATRPPDPPVQLPRPDGQRVGTGLRPPPPPPPR